MHFMAYTTPVNRCTTMRTCPNMPMPMVRIKSRCLKLMGKWALDEGWSSLAAMASISLRHGVTSLQNCAASMVSSVKAEVATSSAGQGVLFNTDSMCTASPALSSRNCQRGSRLLLTPSPACGFCFSRALP